MIHQILIETLFGTIVGLLAFPTLQQPSSDGTVVRVTPRALVGRKAPFLQECGIIEGMLLFRGRRRRHYNKLVLLIVVLERSLYARRVLDDEGYVGRATTLVHFQF
jgi:hypothetical protein